MSKAPPLIVDKWFNAADDLSLESFRGKVVAIHAFQMLCPGCVLHGLPQAKKLSELFDPEQVVVLGLHTVFEHHEAMREDALAVFLHEFRVEFPVAVDRPTPGKPVPRTMELYGMQGTPTWLIVDREGNLRMHAFGRMDDMELGSRVASIATEGRTGDASLYRQGRDGA